MTKKESLLAERKKGLEHEYFERRERECAP